VAWRPRASTDPVGSLGRALVARSRRTTVEPAVPDTLGTMPTNRLTPGRERLAGDGWLPHRRAPLPNLLVVGAMKSGTTSLARLLGRHPDVLMAPDKEVHYFDRHHDRSLAWYRRHLGWYRGERYVAEATPIYLFSPWARDRLFAVLPTVTSIALLRDPVDRAYSHYWHQRSLGREDLTFAEAIEAEPERLRRGGEREWADYSYVARGRYLEQLVTFEDRYGRAALHVELFDDFAADPQRVFDRLCDGLGIQRMQAPSRSFRPRNPSRRVRSTWLGNRTIDRRGRAAAAVRRLNSAPMSYEPMDPRVRAHLVSIFREPNRALARWLGRDLGHWPTDE